MLSSCSVVSDSLQPHGPQHTRFPRRSISPRVCSNSIKSVMPPNHLILCCLLLLPSIFPSTMSFPMSWLFALGDQSIGASVSVPVLPVNNQGWFPLGLTGLISLQSEGLSGVFLLQHQFKSINSSALSLLYGSSLTSIHDYWKNHSFDYTDLCWQSDVSSF